MYGHLHTRQTGNFQQFDVRTTQKQMCISIDGPKLWNSLETIVKEETSIYMFKHIYKQRYYGILPKKNLWLKVDV